MSKFVLLDSRVFAGGADLTGQSNKIELKCEAEEKDVTNYGSGGWKESLGGLFKTEVNGAGQWEAGDPSKVDDETWSKLTGRTLTPWTINPESADVGELAWFTSALPTSYKLGDQTGEVAPWEAVAAGSTPLLRGSVAHPPGTARTIDGEGTGLELGAVTATQKLYAGLHVLSIAGTDTPTITVEIESDADNTFASPTTRISFAAATALGGQFSSVAGAITDTWYRATWTITGTDPSFLFLVSLGIG